MLLLVWRRTVAFDLIPVFSSSPVAVLGISHVYILRLSFLAGFSVYTHFLSSAVSFINRIPAAKMRASATSAPRTILAAIRARSLQLSRATAINVSVQRVAFCN
jgi:hypothetical protein